MTAIAAPSTKAKALNIGVWAKWAEFDTCSEQNLKTMLAAMAHFVIAIKEGQTNPFLVLIGNSGVGKTHLARRVWRWWEKVGKFYVEPKTGASLVRSGMFVLWSDFVNECRQGDSSRADDMMDCDLLILDDIGAGADARGWMADKLYQIIEKRISGRDKKATIITANMSLEQLAVAYDNRISSRLVRLGRDKVVEVDAPDYKMREGK
jgi:DNA replication protein DnaC